MKPVEPILHAAAPLHRGRLFRKYFLLILALVCGALVISGCIGLYFAYQENKAALASLQREKASGAAARIEQFVSQIEQQLAFAALPQLGAEGLEQRRIEFLKLLRVVPAVTDISQIDSRGREQLSVSRLAMDVAGANKDRSQEPAFRNARPGQTWYGPVYFRKETEPYMSLAVRSGGESGPVTVAEVNLKFIWDVVTRIRVGEKGKAYVVDSTGHLVADPDIGLVLRKTDLSGLAQVKAALAPDADDSLAIQARDFAGNEVLTAWAPIEPAREQAARGAPASPLGWKVFVEQPVSEVYTALDATVLRTVLLILAGLLFSALAAIYLARGMVRPISTLQEGAARIGAGDLEQKIDVRTGDELEALAAQFNRMSAQLRESYAGLEKKVKERTAELQQTLEQQTATSEILKVISQATTDVQPVLEAIVTSAARLFPACNAAIFMRDGDLVHLRATDGATMDPRMQEDLRRLYPVPFDPQTSSSARAMAERRMNKCADTEGADVAEHIRKAGRAGGFRSNTVVPLVRDDEGIGTIVITYPEPGYSLSDKQLALLQTFADQAVIAIENVRLFNETKEALERQTATSEILKVISSSTTDVGPVFDAIVQAGLQLFPDASIGIALPQDGQVVGVAIASADREREAAWRSRFPHPLSRDYIQGLAMLEGRVVDIPDAEGEVDATLRVGVANFVKTGYRATTVVPMLRGTSAIGAMSVLRPAPGPLSAKQLALLKTFADQAVIAIENVRLFNETKEALEQQTAIGEILRIISASPSDVNPVLQAVAVRAAQICDAPYVDLIVVDGDSLVPAASFGSIARPPQRIDRETVMGRSILDRQTVQVADLQDPSVEPEFTLGRKLALEIGHRTALAVPLLREDKVLGTILLRRTEVRAFDEKHIALLKTFADQAAIAIENVRLFNETKEALEQQTATAEVLSVISGSITDAHPVFDAISRSVLRLYGARSVSLCVRAGERIERVGYALADQGADDGSQALWPIPLDDKSLTGRTILRGELVHIRDVETEAGLAEHSRAITRQSGVRSVLLAPMHSMGATTGVLAVARRAPGGFSEREVELLRTFADQAVIAMENVRLFREIQEKSAQLEVANKHKSEFLANMSHELRTPLNAIIGFSEVLMERMFGEVNAKQADYLKDIHESGRHLLSLINDILDLSKIEAGRLELELSTFDLPAALSNAMTLVRERAQRHAIDLSLDVDKSLGAFRADERKFKQIMLNLLSNAVKFTPDGGRVSVTARQKPGQVEIAVQDTGIGIAPEDHAAVFEEFKQVGRDYTRKAEGTGLGLALTRRFVELHGGEVRLESALGKGSTFTITLPEKP